MTPDLVDLRLVRLVGAPRTEEVGNDHPIAGLDQRGDEVAVEIAPRRVAMHQHDRGRVTRALVYVMEPAVPGLVPVRLVRPRATECPVRVGHSGCASFDDGAFDGAGRFGYQNHLLPSFSSVLSDIVSLIFWTRPTPACPRQGRSSAHRLCPTPPARGCWRRHCGTARE